MQVTRRGDLVYDAIALSGLFVNGMDRRLRVLLAVLLVAVALLVWLSPLRQHMTRQDVRSAIEACRGAWYAPLVLIALYAVGCVFAVPASLFIVTAGAIWGWALGGTLALAGGMLGAAASFFSARVIAARPEARSGKLVSYLRDASFRSLLIARLLPIFPFAALNYGAGLVRTRTSIFLLSTFLGLIPSNYVFAWSADEIFNGTLSGGAVFERLILVAAVCVTLTVIASVAARHYGRHRAA